MKVRFNETRRITEDGFTLRECEKDQEYDLADTAARYAVNQGWAVEVNPKTTEEAFQEFLAELRAKRIVQNPATYQTMGVL